MARHQPIAVKERTAAALLDMTPAEFRRLVDGGHLPSPRSIGGIQRWDAIALGPQNLPDKARTRQERVNCGFGRHADFQSLVRHLKSLAGRLRNQPDKAGTGRECCDGTDWRMT